MQIKRLAPNAVIPSFQTSGSSGADVYSVQDVDIQPGKAKMVGLGFAVAVPKGFELQVRPRSGLAMKHLVTVLNTPGTIDSDYRGEVKVILINHGDTVFRVCVGDRIAQVVLAKVYKDDFTEVYELDATPRGAGGFGSTGKA